MFGLAERKPDLRGKPPDGGGGSLRILAIGNMYPPHHSGGYEVMWQRAMQQARALGHHVRVLVSNHRETGDLPETDPDVHRNLRMYWDQGRYEFLSLNAWQRLQLERHNNRELLRHLEAFRPDVVSFWSMGCLSLSLIEQVRRRGLPAVFIVHDDWLVYGRTHDQWIWAWNRTPWRRRLGPVVGRACGVPTTVDLDRTGPLVFNSRYTLGRAQEAGVSADEMDVVYPGIDERFASPLPPRRWRWRVLYVGRLDRQKGLDTAVEALAHLPALATLTIWGTGDKSYVSEMKALAARVGAADRVSFHGFADPERLIGAYEEADVVVFPVRWQEPFGLVPLEAMALGRLVVTTARGGSAEYLRDQQNALVFGADNPAAIAERIRRLAEDQRLRERLLAGGRETAARFPVQVFAERAVQKIVETVLAQARPAISP